MTGFFTVKHCLLLLTLILGAPSSPSSDSGGGVGSIVHAFSVPDSFHLLQHAASTVAHQTHAGELLTAYKQQLAANPLPTKMLTGATLATIGDAIAQKTTSRQEQGAPASQQPKYDVPRATSFAIFDMAYRALQHVSFPVIVAQCQGQYLGGLATAALASSTTVQEQLHAAAAMEQTLASQLIIVPFLYYPAFFALTGTMQGLDAQDCINRARENFLPLMQRNLLFWIPVQFVQFGFVPTDLQIPFLSCAGLAWTFILSVSAGSARQYNHEDQDPAEQMMSIVSSSSETDTGSTMDADTAFVQVTDIPDNGDAMVSKKQQQALETS